MKYIFFILLSLFSSFSFSNVLVSSDFPLKITDKSNFVPISVNVGDSFPTLDSFLEKVPYNTCLQTFDGYYKYTKSQYQNEYNAYIGVTGSIYTNSDCSGLVKPSDSAVIYFKKISMPVDNYCDTIQYSVDKSAAEKLCFDKANTVTQDVKFTASCDRESQSLVSQCEINDKPIEPPKPELCDDGSAPPCDDGSGGGGDGSGGGGDGSGGGDAIDLSGILAAIKKADSNITSSVTESNRILGVGLPALDKSNDLLSTIGELSKGLNDKTDSLNSAVYTVNSSINSIDDSINDAATNNFNRVVSAMLKDGEELKKQTEQKRLSLINETKVLEDNKKVLANDNKGLLLAEDTLKSLNTLNDSVLSNKVDLSGVDSGLASISTTVSDLKDGLGALVTNSNKLNNVLTKDAVDYTQAPVLDVFITNEQLTDALLLLSNKEKQYSALLDGFKDSISISSNFNEGSYQDDSFDLNINGATVHVASGFDKFISLADVIRPVIIALCSLIAVSIIFRAD